MADIPQGYREVPEEDRKKGKLFFDRGRTAAETGNYEYAIAMFIDGLAQDPDLKEAHQQLRDISLRRKAGGGKALGWLSKEGMSLRRSSKDDKQAMLNAEKLLAYDPGNTDLMVTMIQAAQRAGYYDTVLWLGPILMRANTDTTKPDHTKFIILKDIYKTVDQWHLAIEAAHKALEMRPDDMDLSTELNHLSAQLTMKRGKYDSSTSFRDSVKDMQKQSDLMAGDSDLRTTSAIDRMIELARQELAESPNEPGKITKLVDALLKAETMDRENEAIELLNDAYKKSGQFRYRLRIGEIKLAQLNRMERSMRASLGTSPSPADKSNYAQFVQEKTEEELKEFQMAADAYPTDVRFRFEAAKRLFMLRRFTDAIPVFQHARTDPKYRADATLALGRSFLEADYLDEAHDTIKTLIDEYPVPGDKRSMQMNYWMGRTLEKKGDVPAALKYFSQVAQWDFNYLDVQSRIKSLRASEQAKAAENKG